MGGITQWKEFAVGTAAAISAEQIGCIYVKKYGSHQK